MMPDRDRGRGTANACLYATTRNSRMPLLFLGFGQGLPDLCLAYIHNGSEVDTHKKDVKVSLSGAMREAASKV